MESLPSQSTLNEIPIVVIDDDREKTMYDDDIEEQMDFIETIISSYVRGSQYMQEPILKILFGLWRDGYESW